MQTIITNSFFSTGISREFNDVHSIEIEDQPFAIGGFGKLYRCISVNGIKCITNQVVKLFIINASGSADINLQTVEKLQKRVFEKNIESKRQRNIGFIEEHPGFIAVPQFSFTGNLNNRLVKGYSSNDLFSLGYTEFRSILESQEDLELYQLLDFERKLLISKSFIDVFNVLHQLKFIHADVKPESIFINVENNTCAIIDFDSGFLSETKNDEPTTWGAPNDWVAPEIWNQIQEDPSLQSSIKVDLFTDMWSVSIGIHYLLLTVHPLFFLTEISPLSVREYLADNEWPHINKDSKWYNQEYDAFYNSYLEFIENQYPVPLVKLFANTINRGYFEKGLRTPYESWALTLKSIERLPEISFFRSDKNVILNGITANLSWEVYGAHSISIHPEIGDVSDQSEIEVSPHHRTSYRLTAHGYFGSISSELILNVFPTPQIKSILVPAPSFSQSVNVKITPPQFKNISDIRTIREVNIGVKHFNNSIVVKNPQFSPDKYDYLAEKKLFERFSNSVRALFTKNHNPVK